MSLLITPAARTIPLGCLLGVPLRAEAKGVGMLLGVNGLLALALCRAARPDWSLTGLLGAAAVTTMLLQLSAVLHELAHLVVAHRLGQPVGALVLNHFGGYVLVGPAAGETPNSRAMALYVAAGPVATLCLWILFVALGEAIRSVSPGLGLALAAAGALNGALLALNLVPVEPLDGGRLLRLALARGPAVAPR